MKTDFFDTESYTETINGKIIKRVMDGVADFSKLSLTKILIDPNMRVILQNSDIKDVFDKLRVEIVNIPGFTEPRALYRPYDESILVTVNGIGNAYDPPTETLYPLIMHEITHLIENHLFSQSYYKLIRDQEINKNNVGYYHRKISEAIHPITRILNEDCSAYKIGMKSLSDVNSMAALYKGIDDNPSLYCIGLKEHDDTFYILSLYMDYKNNWMPGTTFGFGLEHTLYRDFTMLKECEDNNKERKDE